MKPGTKLLSHSGHVWQIARQDHSHPDRVVIRTHLGQHFIAHKDHIKDHARKLRWYHKLFGRVK